MKIINTVQPSDEDMGGDRAFTPGADFYLMYKGERMLDEPLYFILWSLQEGSLCTEFLGSGESAFFRRKLELLSEYLGENVDLEAGCPTEGMISLMEQFENERKGVEGYLRYGRAPSVTVDGVLIKDDKVLLIRRLNEPFRDSFALPGGFVDYGETTEKAVVREMKEETGLDTRIVCLVGVYSDPTRDPRGHTISSVYLLEEAGGEMKEGDDAKEVRYFGLHELPPLAFDHDIIVQDAISMAGNMQDGK